MSACRSGFSGGKQLHMFNHFVVHIECIRPYIDLAGDVKKVFSFIVVHVYMECKLQDYSDTVMRSNICMCIFTRSQFHCKCINLW
jgi:hypothetical protein